MATPMTQQEFFALRKLANKVKKHVTEIGKCNDFVTSIERIELRELIDTATIMLNYANELSCKHA